MLQQDLQQLGLYATMYAISRMIPCWVRRHWPRGSYSILSCTQPNGGICGQVATSTWPGHITDYPWIIFLAVQLCFTCFIHTSNIYWLFAIAIDRWFPLKRRYIETRYWWLRLFDENLHIALHSIEQSELSACVGTSDVDIVFEIIVSNIWLITSNIVDVGEFDHSEERQTIINNTNLSARNIYI